MATVVYDNIGELSTSPVTGRDPVAAHTAPPGSDCSSTYYLSFLSPANASTVDSLEVLLAVVRHVSGNTNSALVRASLYQDAAQSPAFCSGTPPSPGSWVIDLGSFTIDTSVDSSLTTYPITLDAFPALAANTRYWVGLTADTDIDFQNIVYWGYATSDAGTGVAGEYWAATGSEAFPNLNADLPPFQMRLTVLETGALPKTYKFSGQVPVSAPAIAADLRGIVMLIHAFLAGSTDVVFLYAHTADILNFTGWRVYLIWSWVADGGPPPPNLDIATDASAVFLSPDIMDVCCGRAYASITAKSSSFAGLQSLYLGTIDWSVAP